MSLRALGSLLSRRLSPRGIPHARVRAQSIGALAAAGGVTALIGILYSNGDESSLVITGKEIKNVKTEELEDMSVDEPAMKARFEKWMKQFGRIYQNDEEKTMRYEIFKENAIWCDKANAKSKSKASTPWKINDLATMRYEIFKANGIWCVEANAQSKSKASTLWEPNDLADWTFKEMYGSGRQVDSSFWDEYLNEGYPTVDGSEWYEQKLKAKKAELEAATKAEQVGATRKEEGGC